jgi:hypothetical protein
MSLIPSTVNCSVCLSTLNQLECSNKVLALPCSHTFHEVCIQPWLKDHTTCPECRKVVEWTGDKYISPLTTSRSRRTQHLVESVANPILRTLIHDLRAIGVKDTSFIENLQS